MVIVAQLACSGDTTPPPPPPPPPTGDTATVDTHTGTAPGPVLVVGSAQDPSLSVTYTITQTPVREGFDVLATWTNLGTDAWGAPFSSTDPGVALVLLEVLTPPGEVAARMARDDLGFDLLTVYEGVATGRTFLSLSELLFHGDGVPFEPAAYLLENPEKSWVLGLAVHEGERLHLRAATILVPQRASAVTNVVLSDDSSAFVWAASAGQPLVTSHRWTAWTADWEGVTVDALGKPFDDTVVDELVIGKFPVGTTLHAELDDLAGAADATWRMDVARFTDAELALAAGGVGASFPGFTEGPVWALWTRCTTCATPFPAWVAAVEVR